MIFGALVVLLIGLAIAFLVIPVLKKPTAGESVNREVQNIEIAKEKKAQLVEQLSQEQMTQQEYEAALVDLENSLAIDLERQQALDDNLHAGRWVAWFFVLFVPALSILMYLQLGEYRVIENPALAEARTQSQTQAAHNGGKAPSMEELIEKLKNHLRDNPEDTSGWFMLGRTMMSMQNYAEAVAAFERSYELSKTEPNIILALADSLAMINDGNMSGRPEQLVLEALEISPDELTGLWLAGLAAEQGDRNREAYEYWTRLLPMLNDDPRSAAEVKTLLVALKEKSPELPELDFSEVSSSSTALNVSVSLDEKFASQVKADDLVFIYAKAVTGPPMPLAAKRLTVADLPVQVALSDNDAMMPQMKLSGFDQVIVGARVSKSGDPVSKAGDLFDESDVIEHKNHQGQVKIHIQKIKQ